MTSPLFEVYSLIMCNKELPRIRPCSKCKKVPATIGTSRPEGRLQDLYRVVCECGNGPAQWSVSESAAIRLWNTYSTV